MMNQFMKKVSVTVLALALLTGAVVFAATAEPNVNSGNKLIPDREVQYNNMVNKIKVGESMSIIVDENVSSGYSWNIKVEGDNKAVRTGFFNMAPTEKEKAEALAHPIHNEGAKKELTVKGVSKGTATITMNYSRYFDKSAEPAKTMVFVVRVEE